MTKELEQAIRHIKTRADAWAVVKEFVDALLSGSENPNKCEDVGKSDRLRGAE